MLLADASPADQHQADAAADRACVPDCDGFECGDDGCGGQCGTCPQAAPLCEEHMCRMEPCDPDCDGYECGDDGCGGQCGTCPQAAPLCEEHKCRLPCVPDCEGRVCGDDGCGDSCGECGEGLDCVDGTACVCPGESCLERCCGTGQVCVGESCCTPDCQGRECGPDGCEGACGVCDGARVCDGGTCACPFVDCQDQCCLFQEVCHEGACCKPSCQGKNCGDNGCGGQCGECPPSALCTEAGVCESICQDECESRQCGIGVCGGWCGECAPEFECNLLGKCMPGLIPDCEGRDCGPDGLGGSCGECPAELFCVAGNCETECLADCLFKECGNDGCGGSCGDCDGGLECTVGGLCGGLCAQCTYPASCLDIDFGSGLVDWTIQGALLRPHLGQTMAPSGGMMLELTTGGGFVIEGSEVSFQQCLPAGSYTLAVTWKLFSEEFIEFCGGNYQDAFSIGLHGGGVTSSVLEMVIDDLCPPDSCVGCGAGYSSLSRADVAFDQGDVWVTPWTTTNHDLEISQDGTPFTLNIGLTDAGDSIYDTVVLVDRIRFIPCETNPCLGTECGQGPCGAWCGDCPNDQVCFDGSCCVPDCSGRECGDDGCGGSCGECPSDVYCAQGLDMSDPQTQSLAMLQCEAHECVQVKVQSCRDDDPCTDDLCDTVGGVCLHPDNNTCCQSDAECDDGDEQCTQDLCLNGACFHLQTGSEGCCNPVVFSDNFEGGDLAGYEVEQNLADFSWRLSTAQVYEGTTSLFFGNEAGTAYSNSNDGSITSGQILLPEGTSPSLEFWTRYKTESCCDKLTVAVLTEQGLTELDQLAGNSQGWLKKTYDLRMFEGELVQIRLAFHSDSSVSMEGVFIDQLEIRHQCCNDDGDCDDLNPCTLDICVPDLLSGASGCEHLGDCCTDGQDCDDGDVCTQDSCEAGQCFYAQVDNFQCCNTQLYAEDFDQSDPGFTYIGDGLLEVIGWQVSNECGSFSEPSALHFGLLGTGSECAYTLPLGLIPSEGQAISPMIHLPEDSTPLLRFLTLVDITDLEGSPQFRVDIQVQGGESVPIITEEELPPAPGWAQVTADLSTLAGRDIYLSFIFLDALLEGQGTGILVDDIIITTSCQQQPYCGNWVCDPEEDDCNCPSDCPFDPNSCSTCECGFTGGDCWCDDSCFDYGDCCENFCQVCGTCEP